MKSFIQPLLLIVCCSFLACEEQEDLGKTFTMAKGEHYSVPRIIQTLQNDRLSFEAAFDASAIYRFTDQGYQDSKNKLLGFSDCNSLHHENSARFGWQWLNNQLEIYAYCYVNGQRVEKFIGVVGIHEINRYTITKTDSSYIFQLNNNEPVAVNRDAKCNSGIYYILWPYFGGTLAAPHDITIKLRILL